MLRDVARCGAHVTDPPDWRLHYAARTVWEYYCGDGWAPLADVQDETRGLTISGPVRFTIPAAAPHVPHGVGGPEHVATYFVRCRLVSGTYDCPPLLHSIAVNAVPARHAADAPQATLERSDGRAAQSFQLPLGPALPGSVRLHIELDDAADSPWHERDDLERAGPHERAFVLDREAGVVRFGDGRHGRVPPAGARLRAEYRIGGGAAGNLAAGSLGEALAGAHNQALVPDWSTARLRLTLYQPAPAHSGADSETFEDARRRLLERLAAPQRAVTLGDYTALALAAPGLPMARTYALADYHPAYPCLPAPGCVTVVVLPRCPDRLPTPSPALLRALRRYLERRRTLCDELQLVGPRYSVVGVRARLVAPGCDRANLARAACTALDTFLHPLRGGFDSTGWPVGRPVYRSEILALLGRLPGVAYVADLELLAQDEPAEGECDDERPARGGGCGGGCGCGGCDHGGNGGARCGNLAICPDGLPAPGCHTILVETRPEQTAEGAPR